MLVTSQWESVWTVLITSFNPVNSGKLAYAANHSPFYSLDTSAHITFSLSFQPFSWLLDIWLWFLSFLQSLLEQNSLGSPHSSINSGWDWKIVSEVVGKKEGTDTQVYIRQTSMLAVFSLEAIPRLHHSSDACSFLHYVYKHQCLFLVFILNKSQ